MGKVIASYLVRVVVRRSDVAPDDESDPRDPTNEEIERRCSDAVSNLLPDADVTAESERTDR